MSMDALDQALTDLGGKPTPGMGDNRAPESETLQDVLEAQNAELVKRARALIDSASRMPEITNDDVAGKVSDLVKMIAAAIKASEAARMAGKAPYEALSAIVHGFFKKGITDPLTVTKSAVEAKLGVYLRQKAAEEKRLRDEADRLARQAAQLAAAEAAKAAAAMQDEKDLTAALAAQDRAQEAAVASVAASKAAAAKPAEMARTRGDVGSLGTLRQHWTGEVVDRETLDLGPLRQHLSLDDLNKAVRAYVKAGGRLLGGAKIYEAQEVSVR